MKKPKPELDEPTRDAYRYQIGWWVNGERYYKYGRDEKDNAEGVARLYKADFIYDTWEEREVTP